MKQVMKSISTLAKILQKHVVRFNSHEVKIKSLEGRISKIEKTAGKK